MQIESLRYFVELAKAGSFCGAAKRACLSQQGLNKAITSLEAEVGVKLVERARRGIRLTSSGEIFLEHAEKLLEDHAKMLDDIYADSRFADPDEPRIALHLTYYSAQIIRPFIDEVGLLESATIVEEPFHHVIESAERSRGCDLHLVDVYEGSRQKLSMREDLVFEPILVSQLGVVWRDGCPLGGFRTIHREQLVDFPLAIDSHREMMRLYEDVMEDYRLNNVRFGVAQPMATLEYALRSSDVAATFDSFGFRLVQANPALGMDALRFTPLSTPRSLCQVGFLYAKDAKPNLRARHYIEKVKRCLAERYADYFERYPLEQ